MRILKEFPEGWKDELYRDFQRTRVPSSTVDTGAELRVHYMINVTP